MPMKNFQISGSFLFGVKSIIKKYFALDIIVFWGYIAVVQSK